MELERGKERWSSSHEHPLILYEAQKGTDAEFPDLCEGCGKGILGPAYKCSQEEEECCCFQLHKICAELAEETKHPSHPQHPLFLHTRPPYSFGGCQCNACLGSWDRFTYHCSYCKFDLCISCYLKEEPRIEHPSHEHPLNHVKRLALFHCDACDTKSSEDASYLCTSCTFWIHKGCASLQSTIETSIHHNHPLTLAYSLPIQHSKFDQSCEICSETVRPAYWIYYCGRCRYFAHVKCATSQGDPASSSGSENEIKAEEEDLIHLPALPDKYVDLISRFSDKLEEENQISATDQVNHFISHDHPLILSSDVVQQAGPSEMKKKNDEIIILCDGCVLPISFSAAPFYSCAQCTSGFFLHKCCVELPKTVSHPFHTQHPLFLHGKGPDYFTCRLCGIPCNGFSYNCAPCNFSIDVKCASLLGLGLGTIKHEAHDKHLLGQIRFSYCWCRACGEFEYCLSLQCNICSFQLGSHCAMLPRTVRHRYDPHPIYLSYPPFQDHPDEFYCEICEQEINPKFWLYHCPDCDQSFHTRCICPVEEFSNLKFGETFKAPHHPHLLTVVRETKRQSWCDKCGKYFSSHDKPAFECAPCNTIFCLPCIFHGDFKSNFSDVSSDSPVEEFDSGV